MFSVLSGLKGRTSEAIAVDRTSGLAGAGLATSSTNEDEGGGQDQRGRGPRCPWCKGRRSDG